MIKIRPRKEKPISVACGADGQALTLGLIAKVRRTPTRWLKASPPCLVGHGEFSGREPWGGVGEEEGGDRDHVQKTLLIQATLGVSRPQAVALHNERRFH